jgi:CheY-like chemotaxis protein
MPLVDGLASAKMIRSFEDASHPPYSRVAAIHGRIPLFAVSASLVEEKRQEYLDSGFDAWAVKPINFYRLNELMEGVCDLSMRNSCLYAQGMWEQGGWLVVG